MRMSIEEFQIKELQSKKRIRSLLIGMKSRKKKKIHDRFFDLVIIGRSYKHS